MAEAVSIEILGHALGNFSTPGVAMTSAFLLGLMLGAIPIGAAELLALAVGAVQPRSLVLPLVLLVTSGHVLGKAVWYWIGTRGDRLRNARLLAGIHRAREVAGRYRGLGALTLGSSALVGIPPFHLSAVAAGVVGVPLPAFLLVSFAGRLLRFASIASIPGLFGARS